MLFVPLCGKLLFRCRIQYAEFTLITAPLRPSTRAWQRQWRAPWSRISEMRPVSMASGNRRVPRSTGRDVRSQRSLARSRMRSCSLRVELRQTTSLFEGCAKQQRRTAGTLSRHQSSIRQSLVFVLRWKSLAGKSHGYRYIKTGS